MRRCSSARGSMAGLCSCGVYHSQSSPFCVLFTMSSNNGGQQCCRGLDEEEMAYAFNTTSSASSSVDCTLSLGTPSTRLANPNENASRQSNYFGWNILPASKHAPPHSAAKSHRNGNGVSGAAAGSDPLLVRRCANCDTTSTPLWRNGPRGPKSLCNACGIRFKKEERRATAAATASHGCVDTQQMMNWTNHQPQKAAAARHGNHQLRFINDVVGGEERRESDNGGGGGMPFLSWRFNVADRPGLVHEFTR